MSGHEPGTIADCAVYDDGRRRAGTLSAADAARAARDGEGFAWIGLQQPGDGDIARLATIFGLPQLAVEDAVKAHQRPKLEVYDGIVFAVMKPVAYAGSAKLVEAAEIALFIGPRFIVTVRHGESGILRQVRAELDAGSDLLGHGPEAVLYRTADLVVDGYEAVIEEISDDVDEIEARVFGEDTGDHTQHIYTLKRELAELRRAVSPLAGPLERLATGSVPGIDPALAHWFRDVHDHQMRASEALEVHDRLLTDVLQSDLARATMRQSEIALRQNEDMRKISAWAAIALLPTAVAGIYGMNFDNMPELHWRYGYFIVLGAVAAACVTLYVAFRRRGWL